MVTNNNSLKGLDNWVNVVCQKLCTKKWEQWENLHVNNIQTQLLFGHNLCYLFHYIWLMLLSFCLSVSRITLVADLNAFFHSSRRPLPLLVRILHRSRIRYYGKPGQNIDFPFQVSWGYKSHCFLSAAIDFFSGSKHSWVIIFLLFFRSLSVSGVLWGGWSEWRHVYGCMEWSLSWVVQPTDSWLGSISAAVLVETQLSEAL